MLKLWFALLFIGVVAIYLGLGFAFFGYPFAASIACLGGFSSFAAGHIGVSVTIRRTL